MVRSSTKSDKSSKSSNKSDKIISERQKTSIKGTVGEYLNYCQTYKRRLFMWLKV